MNKAEFYRELNMQVEAICRGEPSLIANLANISAILFEQLNDINWSGFYLMDREIEGENLELVLGPFQGRAACVRIPVGRGVCGTAVSTKQSMLVNDVHSFDGHIACDVASNSEVVIPVCHKGEVVAVLDIDSPSLGRFDEDDLAGLEKLVSFIEANWS